MHGQFVIHYAFCTYMMIAIKTFLKMYYFSDGLCLLWLLMFLNFDISVNFGILINIIMHFKKTHTKMYFKLIASDMPNKN